ncbi:unnamed protein product [Meloidogyne enterolobii]|uniref:Uncharacterized protein n=1 Tax=Meloidogyne enterolobii TaxID=390850 RepID=A0ACB1ARK8_MELEN
MELKFKFDPEEFIIGKDRIEYTKGKKHSYLRMQSYGGEELLREDYISNPIRSGMSVVVLIQATDKHYITRINDSDDILYPIILFPPWAINRVEACFFKILLLQTFVFS